MSGKIPLVYGNSPGRSSLGTRCTTDSRLCSSGVFMRSGAGDAPGFKKRRNAVSGRHHYQGDDECQPAKSECGEFTYHIRDSDRCNCKENKADHLMPKRMDRLHGCREHVFHELARPPRQMLMDHDLIVSASEACSGIPAPVQSREYYREDRAYWPSNQSGNRWPFSCITEYRNDRVAPVERGRTWKNVSRA